MSISLHAGAPRTMTSGSTTMDGPVVRPRLAPEHLARVFAEQRTHLRWAQSLDAPIGEHLVRRSIDLLAPYGWRHLRMVTWRQATPGTVAHLVVGPGGVVVIDERIWSGRIYVEAGTGMLRRNGYPCDRETAALRDAVAAVTALLPPQFRTCVTGVLCVTPRDLPAQMVDGVHLVGRLHLGSLLAGLELHLSPLEVHQVAQALTAAFESTTTPAPQVPTQRSAHELAGTPVHLPTDGPPSPSAYFDRRPVVDDAAAHQASGVGRALRSVTLRVAVAVLAGVLTYQNSEAITLAVAEWLGGDTVSVVAQG